MTESARMTYFIECIVNVLGHVFTLKCDFASLLDSHRAHMYFASICKIHFFL